MKRKAICIGINSYGSHFDLRGCVNDADDWAKFLTARSWDASVLAERQATKENIILGIRHVMDSLSDGDIGVVTYSGHGTWVPDLNGDEPDGRDEAIVPIDVGFGQNLLLDDEISELFKARKPGSRVIFITDCCHSGTISRVWINPAKASPRYMPPADIFKDPRTLAKVAIMAGKPHPVASDDPLPGVIHLSGCNDKEYSYDSEFNGRPNGVLTAMSMKVLNEMRHSPLTYESFHAALRGFLPCEDYPQTPLFHAEKSYYGMPVFT